MSNFAKDLEQVVTKTGIDFGGKLRLKFPNFKADLGIECLDLSERSKNGLFRQKITTMGNLLEKLDSLNNVWGLGKKSIKEIKTRFTEFWYNKLTAEQKLEMWAFAICETAERGAEVA